MKNEFPMIKANAHSIACRGSVFGIGTNDAAAVYPREIVKRALALNAAAIIISHNHPSSSLESSIADDRITQRICEAANLLEIRVLDHVIVSAAGTMSYSEQGKMPY